MRIVRDAEIDVSEWAQLYEISENSVFFQSPECYQFYKQLSFLKPFVFGIKHNDRLIALISGYIVFSKNIVLRHFSRRAVIHGNFLSIPNELSESQLRTLLRTLRDELKNSVNYIEIRNLFDTKKLKEVFFSEGFRYESHLNLHIDTSVSCEDVFKRLHLSKKRQVRNAVKSGLFCVESKENDDLVRFYNLLGSLYKARVRLPLFPIEFFQKLIQLPNIKLIVVKNGVEVVGGILLLIDSTIVYEWYIAGDYKDPNNKYSSVLATWSGIKYACDNGYLLFDFMGAGRPNKNYGVRSFKEKFGTQEVEFGRYVLVSNKFVYQFARFVFEYIIRNK